MRTKQHTFMLKKTENVSLLCLQVLRYDLHSLARTTPVSTYLYGSKGIRAIEVQLYIIATNKSLNTVNTACLVNSVKLTFLGLKFHEMFIKLVNLYVHLNFWFEQ